MRFRLIAIAFAAVSVGCLPQLIERSNPNDPCKGCSSDATDSTGGGGGINLISWTQLTGSAQWSARSRFCSVTYNSRVWVIGGIFNIGPASTTAQTWYSFDGTTWTKASDNAPNATGRFGQTCVVFASKIWLIGGTGSSVLNDVWSTSDGITWTQETTNAGWPARQNHTATVYNNRIWVMGGANGGTRYNDVWSSLDGITWTQATANAAWSARSHLASTADLTKLYILGGQTCSDGSCSSNSAFLGDVYSSTDGITWSPVTITPPWGGRSKHAITYMNGAFYISGGTKYTGGAYSDMWSSSDGLNWTQQNGNAVWAGTGANPHRYDHQMLNMGNQIYILGGNRSGFEANDVWRSN